MIYIFTFFVSIIMIYFCQRGKMGYWSYLLSMLPLVVLASCRTVDIGADTHYFYETFRDAMSYHSFAKFYEDHDNEEYYLILIFWVAGFSNNFNTCLFFSYIVIYGLLALSLYRMRHDINVAFALTIYLCLFHREGFNTFRQSGALLIDLISMTFLIRKQYWKSSFIALLAYGFHHSSPLFYIVILLKVFIDKHTHFYSKWIIKFLYVSIIASCLYAFATIVNYLDSEFGVMEMRYGSYLDESQFETNMPLSLLALTIVTLLFFYYIKVRYIKINSSMICFMEYIIIACILICFTGLISTYTVRIGGYFWYSYILFMPILSKIFLKRDLSKLLYILFAMFYWVMTVIIANLGHIYPYKSIFS